MARTGPEADTCPDTDRPPCRHGGTGGGESLISRSQGHMSQEAPRKYEDVVYEARDGIATVTISSNHS